MFVAMNRFKVAAGKEGEFERIWQGRQSYLSGVPGFVQFALLRSDAAGEYISHSTWTDRESFVAWTQSEAFAAGHRQGSLTGVLEGPPQVSTYEAVIVERP
jgi:heme-degrading monooxygenase HmoA